MSCFLLDALDGDVGDAVEAQQLRLDDLAVYVEEAVPLSAPGDVGVDRRALVALPAADAHVADVGGEVSPDRLDPLAHLHGGDVHVGAGLELDAHRGVGGGRGGADAVDVAEQGQRLLQGAGDIPLHFLRRGGRVGDVDVHPERGNARERLQRQAREGDDPEHDHAQGRHHHGDRPGDGEFGEFHLLLFSGGAAWACGRQAVG